MGKRLTEAAVERWKPDPTKRLEIPDAIMPGLYLVIQPSGKKSWAVRYRLKGAPAKYTIGRYPVFGLSAAREEAAQALQAVARGGDPAADKRHRAAAGAALDTTFAAVARKFIERDQMPSNRTWQRTAAHIGFAGAAPANFTVRAGSPVARWGTRQINDITSDDILDYLDATVAAGKGVSANRQHAALRRLFNWATERHQKILPTSPMAKIKRPAKEGSRERILDDAELAAVWRAAGAVGWPTNGIVRLLVLTGQRLNEVAGMRWQELNFEERTWTIPGTRTKNKRAHTLPLSEPALAILAELPRVNSTFSFTDRDKPPTNFATAKELISKEVGAIPHWTFHDLRRTFSSGLARLRQPQQVTELLLNHARGGAMSDVAKIYNRHEYADEKREAMTAWGHFVLSLVEDRPANVVPLRTA